MSEDVRVTLTLPVSLEITEVNGQPINKGKQAFRNHDVTLFLPPGPQQLILHYETVWDVDGENHEVVRSQPILFEFNAQASSKWQFVYDAPRTLKQAKNFAKNSQITLNSDQQQVIGFALKAKPELVFNEKEPAKAQAFPYLEQLQYWWQQASPYEQKQFLEWINQ